MSVRVGGAAGQKEGGACWDRVGGQRVEGGGLVAGGCPDSAAVAVVVDRVVKNLVEADGVKIGVAVVLDILGVADAGVGHDGGAAAWFEGRGGSAVAAAGAAGCVEGVGGAKLMAHLVCDVVDVEGVADRCRGACDALRFAARLAG